MDEPDRVGLGQRRIGRAQAGRALGALHDPGWATDLSIGPGGSSVERAVKQAHCDRPIGVGKARGQVAAAVGHANQLPGLERRLFAGQRAVVDPRMAQADSLAEIFAERDHG